MSKKVANIIGTAVVGLLSLAFLYLYGPLFLVMLAGMATSLTPPPDASKYNEYAHQAKLTEDILSEYACGNLSLKVTQTDTAVKGVRPNLGNMGRPPELIDIYILEGFRDRQRIFSVAHTPQNWSVPEKYKDANARWLYEIPPTVKTSFIIDQGAYGRVLEAGRVNDIQTLVMSPDIPEQYIRDLAACYVTHKEELVSALGWEVSILVVPFPTQAHLVPSKE